jgi:hypothetical protein
MMPNGREVRSSTELPMDSHAAYLEMQKHGCRFEAEMLTTGQVSVTISDGKGDVDIEVSPNGPEVQKGMVAMLNRGRWRINRTIHAGAFLLSAVLIAGCEVDETSAPDPEPKPFVLESAQLFTTPATYQNFAVFVLNDTNANTRYLMVMTPNGTAVTPMAKPQ